MGQGEPRAWQSAKSLTACVGEGRRSVTVFVVLPLVLLAALLLWCKPALALSQRGHVFSFSFGSEGKAGGQFAHPSGIAVNDSTGDVYVADRYNDRVEEFKPDTVADKLVSESYAAEFDVPDPEYVAVDDSCYLNGKSGAECTSLYPSNGDVYVVGARSVRTAAELEEEAGELKAEEVQLKAEAKQLNAEATRLSKEAEKLTGAAREAKEKEAKEKEEHEAKLMREAEAKKEGAKEDLERAKAAERKLPPGEKTEEQEEVEEEAADPEHFWVYKFSPAGTPIARIREFKSGTITKEFEEEEEALDGIGVDSSGSLFVYQRDGEIYKFDDAAEENQSESILQSGLAEEAKPGFAVDSEDNLYVGVTSVGELEEFEPLLPELEGLEGEAREERLDELEYELTGDEKEYEEPTGEEFAVAAKLAGATGKVLSPGLLDFEYAAAVAVNPTDVASNAVDERNDVYLDNVTLVAGEKVTTIAAFSPAGKLIQRFGAPGLKDGDGTAVDSETGAVYVADAQTDRVDVFELEEPGAPKIESLSVSEVGPSSAEVSATIDPDAEAETSYRFQYGTASCATTSSCAEVPAEPGQGQGFGDQPVSVRLTGLSPATTYHLRAIAENPYGGVASHERTFTTQTSSIEASLLDGRAWELVSPPEKHGALIELTSGFRGGVDQSSTSGGAIAYIADAPIGAEEPQGYLGPKTTQIVSTRAESGWSSRDIQTPTESELPFHSGTAPEYQFFSSDLSLGLLSPTREELPALPSSQGTLYLRDDTLTDATCATAPETCYEPLLTTANETAGDVFATMAFKGATPDLQHVVFSSPVPLISKASGAGLYEWSAGEPPAEQLQLVSVLPTGAQATGESNLAGEESRAISDDGIWVAFDGNYLRESEHEGKVGHTYQIDEPDIEAPPSHGAAHFELISAAESKIKVFFTDEARLTKDSTAREGKEDLYVFEPEKPAGERVTDLSPDIVEDETADVPSPAGSEGSGMLGASEDGSLVYFVASGVLAEGAQRGSCESGGPAGCNLYVVHYDGDRWERPRFVARLTSEDRPDWRRGAGGGTAEASPNGEYLAFMSDASLTGYDNTDANSGHPDEEVYLYDYSSGQVACASCDPSGGRPVGVHDTAEAGEGQGLLVDRPEVWNVTSGADAWLAGSVPGWERISSAQTSSHYKPRYLSNGGRLFLDSADALVPLSKPTREEAIDGKAEQVGVENVYEYEPNGTGSCQAENTEGGCVALISSGESEQESAFMDASENGDDAFFLTSAKLSPLDTDAAFDLYDARACTQAPGPEQCPSAPVSQTPCDEESSCKGGPSPYPTYAPPLSSTVAGSGNIVSKAETLAAKSKQQATKTPTRAERLAAALKACRKDAKKHRRLACERQARKRYAAKSSKKPSPARESSAKRNSIGRSSSGRNVRGRS